MGNAPPMDERLGLIEKILMEQDAALHHLHARVESLNRGEAPVSEERTPMRDTVWACSNCAARLGLYNKEADEMRVRYKDFVVYIRPGVSGMVKVPCRRCGEENILQDTRLG